MSVRAVSPSCSRSLLSADHRSVEEGRLPGNGRVRELQAAAAGSSGRRPGDPADTLPHAALHRHGARRLAGPLPALQGQPIADAQQPLRLGTGTVPLDILPMQNVSATVFGCFESNKRWPNSLEARERHFSFPFWPQVKSLKPADADRKTSSTLSRH